MIGFIPATWDISTTTDFCMYGGGKSLLVGYDWKNMTEAIEEALYNQKPYTVALIIASKNVIIKWIKGKHSSSSNKSIERVIKLIEYEILEFTTGDKYQYIFS